MYENEIENIASRGTNEEIYYGLLELTKNATQQRGKGEGSEGGFLTFVFFFRENIDRKK